MRVAVDARTLQSPHAGGVARYVRGLLEHVPDGVDVDALVVAGRAPADLPAGVRPVALGGRRLPNLAWLELRCGPWLRRDRPDAFVAPFYATPLRCPVPAAVAAHDLAPFVHPVDFGAAKRAAWRLWMSRSIRRADVVLTVSEWVRGQLEERFGTTHVVVAQAGVSPTFGPGRRRRRDEVAATLGLPVPYVLAVGGANRRNLPVALDAWRRARPRIGEVALAVVGGRDVAPEPGVVALPRLADDDLAVVVAGAEALLYPTTHEGYGLPAREALDSGVPVVCSRVGSLPEILGDAGVWCGDEPDADRFADALAGLLTDAERRAEVVRRSLARSAVLPGAAEAATQVWAAVQRMETGHG